MLILGFGCKVNVLCASNNGLALWWQLVAGSGVFGVTLNQSNGVLREQVCVSGIPKRLAPHIGGSVEGVLSRWSVIYSVLMIPYKPSATCPGVWSRTG